MQPSVLNRRQFSLGIGATALAGFGVARAQSEGRIVLEVAAADRKTLQITVTDNGMGVSKADAPHIFDRFYKAEQSHSPGEGVGLGLAICRAILERHGQSIRLLDTTDGASFRFTLDRADEKNGRAHAADSAR